MPATKAATRIQAVLGNDEAAVKEAARAHAAKLNSGGEFGADIIDGVADNAAQAADKIHSTIEALLTFPFFGGEKLVWLKSANFLGDSQMGRAAAVIEGLEKLVEILKSGLPEGITFLLSATEIDKRRSFYKTLQKIADLEVFDQLDTSRAGWEEKAAALVEQMADERDLPFSKEALELFTLRTGGDRRVIATEIEKLALYRGHDSRMIDADDVRALVSVSRASVIFELGNAVAERQLKRALDLVDALLFQRENAVGILLVALIPTVRNLLLVKDLMTRHRLSRPAQPFFFGKTLDRLSAEATAHLPRKKDGTLNAYTLGLAAVNAHRYSVDELRRALDACLDANVEMITSSLDTQVILSRLVVRIVTGAN